MFNCLAILVALALVVCADKAAVEDRCSEFGQSCSACLSHQFCGWCSVPVHYTDGTQGTQCAGFRGSEMPFVCPGRYNTMTCDAKKSDVEPAKAASRATDRCSEFGQSCSTCLSHQFCGWCTVPVEYSDGTQGTQCAGFSGETPFVCPGRYNTMTCDAKKSDVEPAKAASRATDRCSEFGQSCSACLSHQFCGWCSVPVHYTDGTQGTQCAGFRGSEMPFVCPGRYNTMTCDAKKSDVEPAKAASRATDRCSEFGQSCSACLSHQFCGWCSVPVHYTDGTQGTQCAGFRGSEMPFVCPGRYNTMTCDAKKSDVEPAKAASRATDRCSEFGQSCSACLSHQFCGWCSVPVHYTDGTQGTQCAGFRGSEMPFVCPGRYNTMTCDAKKSDVEPAKAASRATDRCSEFGQSCSTCLSHQFCGWCTVPVEYSDGTQGTQCAGFSGETPFVCRGRYNTMTCDAKKSDVEPAKTASRATDRCSEFGQSCSTCLSHQFCGWCTVPVEYSDGTQGTQCAGFSGETPFVCRGRYNTMTCDAKKSDVDQAPIAKPL